jgi:3-hydroxyacyl-CoA dehydrogenase
MLIEKVACVGAGLIGHSWVALFVMKGYQVDVQDVNEDLLVRAFNWIRSDLSFLAEEGLITRRDAEKAIGRMRMTTDISEAVSEADYVQESVFEDYKDKKRVFRIVDAAAPREAILASSTTGLLMTEIQKATKKPERCIVAHPWNPPLLIPLVELVPGEKTSPETVKTVYEFMKKLGKIPVVLRKEVPGFIGNRLQIAVWREAISLVDRGVASVEDVDKALCAGPGIRWAMMGPNLTLHLGGGEGGLEYFIKHIGPTYSQVWGDMDNWTKIPPSAAKKITEGVKKMDITRGRTMEELVKWRDRKLMKLLRILYH